MNAPIDCPAEDHRAPRVAIVMSRFPTVTETFVLADIVGLERLGVQVEIFPILQERGGATHSEASAADARAHHLRVLSLEVLRAQAHWLGRHPLRYLGIWTAAIRGNLRSPNFLARTPYALLKAAAFARRMETLGVEHVHAHFATHPTTVAWAVNRLLGTPYSFTAHAHDIYVDRAMLAEKIRRASFVVTVSAHNCRLLAGLYGTEAKQKLRWIDYGIDTSFFRSPANRRERNAVEPLRVVCVAQLSDYKGHRYLLEALALLRRGGQAVQCRLVGDGEMRAELEALSAELGVADVVEFCGAQPRERVRELLGESDVMVLPSIVTSSKKMEGVPNALIEAMSMQLPVISTSISGIGELVEDGVNGFLVEEANPPALVAALGELAADPELGLRMGDCGRATVVERFNVVDSVRLLRDQICEHPAQPLAESEPAPKLRAAAVV